MGRREIHIPARPGRPRDLVTRRTVEVPGCCSSRPQSKTGAGHTQQQVCDGDAATVLLLRLASQPHQRHDLLHALVVTRRHTVAVHVAVVAEVTARRRSDGRVGSGPLHNQTVVDRAYGGGRVTGGAKGGRQSQFVVDDAATTAAVRRRWIAIAAACLFRRRRWQDSPWRCTSGGTVTRIDAAAQGGSHFERVLHERPQCLLFLLVLFRGVDGHSDDARGHDNSASAGERSQIN